MVIGSVDKTIAWQHATLLEKGSHSRPFRFDRFAGSIVAMTATPTERTVIPAGRIDRLAELLAALETARRPALVAADGTRIEIPDELFEVLHEVAIALSRGLAITVAPRHTVLTTGEAADLLGVSRPTVVRLLESGEIPFSQPGRHRRIRLDDLLAHQERSRRSRAVGLDEMVHAAEEAGLYDLPDDAVVERGPHR